MFVLKFMRILLLISYSWGRQICEQKSEKKNTLAIEYLVFFSHTKIQ